MKKTLAILVCLVLMVSILSVTASADTIEVEPMVWKFACSTPDGSTWVQGAQYFAELIGEATNGAITVEYYPVDQLTGGSQTDGIQALMDGTTEISMHSNIIYSSFDDRFSVVSLPFLFKNTDEADAVLDGEGGDMLQAILEEYGLHCMGIAENGFRHPTSNTRQIKAPEDFKGLKIRVAGSSVLLKAYEAWGADYTKANWSEVYTGIQTGTYDCQENPVPSMDAASIQEVTKYCTYWTGAYDCLFFCINGDLYNSLSPELQAVVDECGQKAVEYQRAINRTGDKEILDRWEAENGVSVYYLTEEEQGPFKALSDSVYQYYADILENDDGMSHEDVVAFLDSFGAHIE